MSVPNCSREYLKNLTEEEKYLIGIDYFIKMKEHINNNRNYYLPALYYVDSFVGHIFTIKDFLPNFYLNLSEHWFCVTLQYLKTYPGYFTLKDMHWSELYSLKRYYLMGGEENLEFIQEIDQELEIKELELCL